MFSPLSTNNFEQLEKDIDSIIIKASEIQSNLSKESLEYPYTRLLFIDELTKIQKACEHHLTKLKRRL